MAKETFDPHAPVPGQDAYPYTETPSTQKAAHIDGREYLSPCPVEVPVRYQRGEESLGERVRQMVRSEALRIAAAAKGFETFEEADDFDVGDPEDDMPWSPYEVRDLEGAVGGTPPAESAPKTADPAPAPGTPPTPPEAAVTPPVPAK